MLVALAVGFVAFVWLFVAIRIWSPALSPGYPNRLFLMVVIYGVVTMAAAVVGLCSWRRLDVAKRTTALSMFGMSFTMIGISMIGLSSATILPGLLPSGEVLVFLKSAVIPIISMVFIAIGFAFLVALVVYRWMIWRSRSNAGLEG